MGGFSESDQARIARDFFRAEIKNIDAASSSAIKIAASALQRETRKQLRANFKKGPGSSGSFHRAVKIKNLPSKAGLGPAAYVSLGVPFMRIFEEGGTVRGRSGNLIILLPEGERMGFRRITKGNPWPRVWQRISKAAFVMAKSDGSLVLYRGVPIYKIQLQVQLPKKISFYKLAEEIGNQIFSEIRNLLDGS
ncbi:MAG: hypothetical protein HC934_02895 [Acaryochloridaceae cyanobacterium SU_2_1]|nr:hypothetical protein [Acaryochloridaceae cyanobacterium SU_2_1]